MRQRNDTGQTLTVHTDPPRRLEPGDEVDWPVHIVGLTQIPDEPEPAEKSDGSDGSEDAGPDTNPGTSDDAGSGTNPPAKPARAGRNTAKEATN